MGLITYLIISGIMLFLITFYEKQLKDINMKVLTEAPLNGIFSLIWPATLFFAIPVGIGRFLKNKNKHEHY